MFSPSWTPPPHPQFCRVKAKFISPRAQNLGGPRPPVEVVSARQKMGPRPQILSHMRTCSSTNKMASSERSDTSVSGKKPWKNLGDTKVLIPLFVVAHIGNHLKPSTCSFSWVHPNSSQAQLIDAGKQKLPKIIPASPVIYLKKR